MIKNNDLIPVGTKITFYDGTPLFPDDLIWGVISDYKNGCYLVTSLFNNNNYDVYPDEVISEVSNIDQYIKLFKELIYNEKEIIMQQPTMEDK